MMSLLSRHTKFLALILAFVMVPVTVWAKERTVGVLISKEIAPYISMVRGLEQQLGNIPVERFFLDKQDRPYSLAGGGGELNPEYYDVLVAVGPGALRYLHGRANQVPLVFGMVLNPQNILAGSAAASSCGVSLNLPIEGQLSAIKNHLPDMTQLGVLFDPDNNRAWYEAAERVANNMEIKLVPLQVQRESNRLEILGNFSDLDVLLFIPDKTIISKAVIQYVIKQAVLQRTPVVGYNQFFYDSGASLAFIIDYAKIGGQVADQVEAILSGRPCKGQEPPLFQTQMNSEVWQALQLSRKGGGL